MSSTNRTTNYNLPQFISSDVPTWLVDVNGAMSAIDTAMKANADSAGAAASAAATADAKAETAAGNIQQTNTALATLQSTVQTNTGAIAANTSKIGAATLNTGAQNLSGAVNELLAALTITEDIGSLSVISPNTLIEDERNELGKIGIMAMLNATFNPNGTIPANTWYKLAQLPEGYRPASSVSFNSVIYGSGNTYISVVRGEITPEGYVQIHRANSQGSINNAVRITIDTTWLLN